MISVVIVISGNRDSSSGHYKERPEFQVTPSYASLDHTGQTGFTLLALSELCERGRVTVSLVGVLTFWI